MATGIDHVSLLALDVNQTAQFYVNVLGLRITDRVPGDERSTPDRVWLGNGQRSFITVTRSSDRQPGQLGIGVIHHIALAVDSYDALLKWKRLLEDKNILLAGPYNQGAYHDLVFIDPDGVLVELATREPGFAITQDGQEVYRPPRGSMAPSRDEEQISRETWPQPVTRIEPDMALQGLHHVSIITSSLDQTNAFYREILHLPLVRKVIDSDDPEVERWYWGLDGGRPGTLVAAFPIVHPDEGGTAVSGHVGPGIAQHYALGMGSSESLQDRLSSLTAAGIEATSVPDEAGHPAISTHDPDGQIIELVTAEAQPATGEAS